jgi:hypothetical protein
LKGLNNDIGAYKEREGSSTAKRGGRGGFISKEGSTGFAVFINESFFIHFHFSSPSCVERFILPDDQ